jgi:hypothetical protein
VLLKINSAMDVEIHRIAQLRPAFVSEARAEAMSRQSECADPRIRLTVLYRETETGKRLMGRAQAICIGHWPWPGCLFAHLVFGCSIRAKKQSYAAGTAMTGHGA